MDANDPGAVCAGNARERHQQHRLFPRVLVPPRDQSAADEERRPLAAPLRRRGLSSQRLGERLARRQAQRRLHAVHDRHHGVRCRAAARHRRAGGRRSGRIVQATRQTGLAARAALDLVLPHQRHLADGVDGSRAVDVHLAATVDTESRTLGNGHRGVARRPAPRHAASRSEDARQRTTAGRRYLPGDRGRSTPAHRIVRSRYRRLSQWPAMESVRAHADRRRAPVVGRPRRAAG